MSCLVDGWISRIFEMILPKRGCRFLLKVKAGFVAVYNLTCEVGEGLKSFLELISFLEVCSAENATSVSKQEVWDRWTVMRNLDSVE